MSDTYIWLLYYAKEKLASKMWQRLNTERGLLSIVQFWVIRKPQYTGIYGKSKRGKKTCTNGKLDAKIIVW